MHDGSICSWLEQAKNSVLKNPDGSAHHCEDPFIWHTKRGWHLLTHNQSPPQGVSSCKRPGSAFLCASHFLLGEIPAHTVVLADGYSLDGVSWHLSPTTPYNCTLRYTDGTTGEASGCGNRPQIFFDESAGQPDTEKPLFIINGAQSAKPGGGKGTWTLFRPLAQPSGRGGK